MKITNRLILILPVLLAITACVPRYYVPIPGDGISREEQYAVLRTDSLLVAVRPQAYPGGGGDFANRFFSIRVIVRNLRTRTMHLGSNSFAILAGGRQYDYYPLQFVLTNLQTSYLLENGLMFEDPSEPQLLPSAQDRQQEYALELMAEYMSFGDLLPGGRKEGFLFYDQKLGSTDAFSIDVLGKRVDFILHK